MDASPLVQQPYPLLADTASVIADPLVRNRATSAATSRTPIPPTITQPRCWPMARRSWRRPEGERDRSRSIDFFTGLFETSLGTRARSLTEIRIPRPQRAAAAPTSSSSARSAITRPQPSPPRYALDASGACA